MELDIMSGAVNLPDPVQLVRTPVLVQGIRNVEKYPIAPTLADVEDLTVARILQ